MSTVSSSAVDTAGLRKGRPRVGGERVSIPAVPQPAAGLNSRTPSEGVITA